MMRVLVTAATRYGATAEIATAIAEVLGEHGLEAVVLPLEQVGGVDGYDAVVVGSAVYAGHWLKPARELVERHAGALAGRPVWLFSSGPVGDPPKPEEDPVDVADLLAATGAREHRIFAGKLVRKQLSFPERAIVSALRVPRATSATGPRSASGRPGSPMPWEPAPNLGRTGAVIRWADRWTGDPMAGSMLAQVDHMAASVARSDPLGGRRAQRWLPQ